MMSLYTTQSVLDPDTDLHRAIAGDDVELLATILLSNLAHEIGSDGPRLPAVMALSNNTAVVIGSDAVDQSEKLNDFRQAGRFDALLGQRGTVAAEEAHDPRCYRRGRVNPGLHNRHPPVSCLPWPAPIPTAPSTTTSASQDLSRSAFDAGVLSGR